MRILIASAYYWPEFSGTAPYVTAPAEYLSSRGHDVHIVAAFPHYPQWEELEPRRFAAKVEHEGVTIHRRWHTIPTTQSARNRAIYEASMLGLGLTALPAVPRPDVIFGVTPALASASLAYAASRVFRRPYGLVIHDLMGKGASQTGISTGNVGSAIERVELALGRKAGRILALTDGMKQFFVDGGVPTDRIDVVPTWTLRRPPEIEQAQARRLAGWSDEDFVCLHGGNMGQKQGLNNVVDAADVLQRKGCERIRIILVGDGNDRRRLEQRAQELGLRNLDFMPMQPTDRYDQLVAAADVLLLNQRPAVADMSLPSKLSSYFAAGRPVIAAASSDSVAANEVERAQAGLVVDPSRPEALAAGLERLANERHQLEELGNNGKRYSESHLSSKAILPQYEQFVIALARS
jgi:colanic acid biosynthesis glycosyl transferase WcaI